MVQISVKGHSNGVLQLKQSISTHATCLYRTTILGGGSVQAWVQLRSGVDPMPTRGYGKVPLGHQSPLYHVVMPPSAQLVIQAFSVQLLLSLHTPRARSIHT